MEINIVGEANESNGHPSKESDVTVNAENSNNDEPDIINLQHVGWRKFFPVVVLCQFLVLVGNRFWFYLLMYLEYNIVMVLC